MAGSASRIVVLLLVALAAVGFVPAAADAPADPCADPGSNPLCAVAPTAGAACVAVGLAIGGSLDITQAESRASSAGQQHQDRRVVQRALPDGRAEGISSVCDASGSPPDAVASASASSFGTDLTSIGIPVMIDGVTLTALATSSSGFSTNASRIHSGRVVVNGTEVLLQVNPAANTVVPIGASSYIVFNEQHSSDEGESCARNTGSALRIHLDELDIEITIAFVSTVACRVPVTIDTNAEPSEVGPGEFIQDTAFVSGPAGTPTGSVDFYLCQPSEVTPAGCTAGGNFYGTAPLSGGVAFMSDVQVGPEPGRYCWRVEYSGDDVYLPGSHTNNDSECHTVRERVLPQLETESQPSGNIQAGQVVHDFAQLFGGQGPFDGTMAFFICRPFEVVPGIGCPGGIFVGSSGVGPAGEAFGPPFGDTSEPGTYCWRAEYSGDGLHEPVSHSNDNTECFTVQAIQDPGMRSDSMPNIFNGPQPPGVQVQDFASAFGPGPIPTGQMTFYLCQPAEVAPGQGCVGGGVFVGTSPLNPNGEAVSPSIGGMVTFQLGIYCWRAQYSGDANWNQSAHTNYDTECFEVQ